MIWAILAVLGVPLWLIAVALILLLHRRRQVKRIADGVACKPRVVSGELPGLKPRLARFSGVGHWIHDVLVLHGGDPFLSRTTLYGIKTIHGVPSEVDPDKVKRVDDPVAVRFRHDSGATIEVVCAQSDLQAMLGPFADPVSSARGGTAGPPRGR